MAEMPALTEREWQDHVLYVAALCHWRVAHFRPARTDKGWRTPVAADGAGFPDLVLVRDRVIFAELKTDRGKLSEDQRAWKESLDDAGAEYHIWRPCDIDLVVNELESRRET